jgi:hypothetical protein
MNSTGVNVNKKAGRWNEIKLSSVDFSRYSCSHICRRFQLFALCAFICDKHPKIVMAGISKTPLLSSNASLLVGVITM